MRKKLLLGNWKMNKTVAESKEFASKVAPIAELAKKNNILVGVAPTFLSLDAVKQGTKDFIVASQNCHFEDSGAFTGEVSIPMLKAIDIDWVIIGHSERRQYDNETDEKCNKKIKKLVANGMTSVYCVGETLKEFEKGLTKEVVGRQLREGLKELNAADFDKIVVAYEPVWSIGTGKNASEEIAQDICSFVRETIKDMYGEVSSKVLVIYGGSVKPENIAGYLSQKDVDGALVGGASLKIESFEAMVKALV